MSTNKCFLKSIDNETPQLPDIEISASDFVYVGRSPECELRDEMVSRKQLKVKADFTRKCIVFEVIGSNPSVLNQEELNKNEEREAKHGDVIEVIAGKYPYMVHFQGADESTTDDNENADSTTANGNNSTDERIRGDSSPSERDTASSGTGSVFTSAKRKPAKKHQIVRSDDEDDTEEDARLKRRKSKIDLTPDKAPFAGNDAWQTYNKKQLIVYTSDGCKASNKIAAYDMDGTLITTKSGRVFPTSANDWKIAFGSVKSTLRTKIAENYKLVIFTNQAGFTNGKTTFDDFHKKIENIVKEIGVPMQVFIATGDTMFRKPLTNMWRALIDHLNDDVPIDRSKSFFVGDAAGRPENKALKKKKDHSDADRLFALNLQLPFFTPEEHFLKHAKMPGKKLVFEPRDALKNVSEHLLDPHTTRVGEKGVTEVIVMVGVQGSGKSAFCRNHLKDKGYEVINRDELKTWQKCVKRAEECLANRKSVVIDNTSGKADERARYITVAKTHKVRCRCFIMNTTPKQAEHNIHFRELIDPSYAKISSVTVNAYHKNYKKPALNEGFAEIVHVNFIPVFRNDEEKELYGSYLMGSY